MTVITEDRFSFEEYTDPEIIEYTHSQNAETWKGPLTVKEYCEREHVLGSSGIARKGESAEIKKQFPRGHELLGLKYFVLKDKSLEETSKTSQIIASCEALCRLGYAIHPESHGKIVPVMTTCIGGVFTPASKRGNGYARIMINRVNGYFDRLAEAPGAPDFVKYNLITLYSEVGEYYAKSGYQSLHVPVHTIIDLDMLLNRYCAQQSKEGGRSLGFDDYEDLVDLQKKQFDSGLMKLHKKFPHKFIFTVAADLDVFKWFQLRDLFVMGKLGRKHDNLKFGFALKDNSHIIWHHNWNDNSLVILKIYMGDDKSSDYCENTLRQLLRHAIDEAKACEFTSLTFWDEEIPIQRFPELYSVLTEMEKGSQLFAENGSLSAVRPPKGFDINSIEWDNNTKFCWF